MVATMHYFYLMILLFSTYRYCSASECDTHDSDEQSYVVQIVFEQHTYFCPGVLVRLDWVLTTYSCFKQLQGFIEYVDYITNQPNKSFQNNNQQQQQQSSQNSSCFDIQSAHIKIKSARSNCINITLEENYESVTIPMFGVLNGNYHTQDIEWENNSNSDQFDESDENTIQNNSLITNTKMFHDNDLLLLKLRDNLFDNESQLIQINPTKYHSQNANTHEIYFQSQYQENQSTQFVKTKVFSESENDDFKCPPYFYAAICTQEISICLKQIYYCGKFSLPDEDPEQSYELRSGDPLVVQQNSGDKQIFGFFKTDFIPHSFRKYYSNMYPPYYYSYIPGNYSFEENGAVFVGFTEENIDWIDRTVDQYSGENLCSGEKNVGQFKNISTIIVSFVIGIILIVFVVIIIYNVGSKTNMNEIEMPLLNSNLEDVEDQELSEMREQSFVGENENIELQMVQNSGLYSSGQEASANQGTRQGDYSNLNLTDMVGLSEMFASINENRDGVFGYLPNWWQGIKLPQGVRDIPIHDLKGIKRLGAGGFAVVYEAEFEEHAKGKYTDINEKKFAVKIVFKEYFQIKDQMEAILKEVAAMSKLQSQYIVKLIGASLVIRPSIVMELVSGGSLEDLLNTEGYKSHQTSLEWKLKLFLNISRGIQYLHSQRILHRDLKPANILIQDPYTPIIKISDFGLAKIKQTSQTLGNTKNRAGTKHYMAPEMYDESASIDEKVDIWALAVIMQQVLRGIKPWKDQLEQFVICRVSLHKEPPDNGILPQYCPQDLRGLIVNCWKTSCERPTADEIVQQLEVMLQREST